MQQDSSEGGPYPGQDVTATLLAPFDRDVLLATGRVVQVRSANARRRRPTAVVLPASSATHPRTSASSAFGGIFPTPSSASHGPGRPPPGDRS